MLKHIRFAAVLLCMALGLGNVAQAQKAASSAGGHKYVDLGLPSGTLWATCNIGASKPEDYGNYYAWGETSTKSTYDWNSYKYANGNYDKLTKYCYKSNFGNNGFTDDLTELQKGDDPAIAQWGSGWRTPTKAQWDELLANTTNLWMTKNGVEGCLFTSKKNGQTLFLPAVGHREESEIVRAGFYGIYLSGSIDIDIPCRVYGFFFNSERCYMDGSMSRNDGYCVRPVRQK